VPGIVGFGAVAAELGAGDRLAAEGDAARRRTGAVATGIAAQVAGVRRYGDPDDRLPNLVCLGIEGVEAEPILLALDQHGVAVHSGSSCSSEALEPSPVLEAMGADADRSLRASVGWSTTDDDVTLLLDVLPGIVDRLRALRSS
jgi:cysteine desulfurase